MLTLTVLLIVLFIFAIFYIISFFNAKIAIKVDLILFTVSNLKVNKKNARKAPMKFAKLVRALIYKRRLFANKIATRRLIKKITHIKPANT